MMDGCKKKKDRVFEGSPSMTKEGITSPRRDDSVRVSSPTLSEDPVS